ncbi:MAG: hypothetical protein GY861_00925 [bacterium]|nr:hypothetical protein [bacterium]
MKVLRRMLYAGPSAEKFGIEQPTHSSGSKSMEPGLGIAKTITTITPHFPSTDLEMPDAPSRSSSLESPNDSTICLLGKRVISKDENSDRHIAEISIKQKKTWKKEIPGTNHHGQMRESFQYP